MHPWIQTVGMRIFGRKEHDTHRYIPSLREGQEEGLRTHSKAT